MFSVRRAALRAASSSSLAAASRQQPGSSFALQFARAAFRPSLVAPTARLFSQTPRRAEEDEEKKAVNDAIKAAESLGSTAPPAAAETAVPAENQSSGIFINNMSFNANEENLREGFAKYGEIVYVNVAKDARGMSRGFAFVTFDNPASAEAAVAETNQSFWHGRRINVEMRKTSTRDNTRRDRSFGSRDNDNNNGAAREQRRPFRERSAEPAEPTNSLYIGNIPYEASDAELNRMFRELDNVTDVRVAVDRNTGWPRGFAHADFTDVESAVRAMEKLNSTTLAGRRLRTDYAQGARRNNNNQDRGSRSPRSYEDRGAPAQSGDSSEPASF